MYVAMIKSIMIIIIIIISISIIVIIWGLSIQALSN